MTEQIKSYTHPKDCICTTCLVGAESEASKALAPAHPNPGAMKYRSVDAQLFKDMKDQIEALISYGEMMIVPSVKKEEILDKAREVYKRAKQQNMEEG